MEEKKQKQNNILSFNQPAEFFIKKAEKHIDAGNLLEALEFYRRVMGMEPENVEYLLSVAQIYSEMGLYAESNDVLLKIAKFGHTPTECLFALGCNYMGMKNYELADEAFEQYLAIDPNGEYAEDIDELIDLIDEEEYEEEGLLHDVGRRMVLEEAYEGKQSLDKGDYKSAIAHLEKAVKEEASLFSAMNNLALAYFFDGKKHKAIEMSKKVLALQPNNLHACCNLALFYSDLNDHASATMYLSKLSTMGDIAPEDMHKVALTYCELGYHEKAYKWFLKIVAFQPYDIRILHFCGLAAFNCGQFAEALSCYVKILKIDPDNSLAAYYKKRAEEARKNKAHKELEYVYQVQYDEIKRRISYLNECLKKKDQSIQQKWKEDAYFKSVIYWGLHFGDEYIKKIVLEIMSMFSDDKVEEIFRDFLLKSTESDEIKNDIFMYLKRMGAKEPYVAYIKGAIAEVRVGTVSESIRSLPSLYAQALGCFVKNVSLRHGDSFVSTGVDLLVSIVKEREDNGTWIRKPEGLAAALELIVCELMENEAMPVKKELAQIYGVSVETVNRYYNRLYGNMGDAGVD